MQTLTCIFNQASFSSHLYGYYNWLWLIWLFWLIIDDNREKARRLRLILLRSQHGASD